MFLISSGIGSQGLEIRPDHRRDPALLGLTSDFRRRCLMLPQRFLKSFDSDGQPDLIAMPEVIRDCLGHCEYIDGKMRRSVYLY